MAFRKTGSRRIVVDGVTYLWRFNHRPTQMAWDGCTDCTVTVQQVARVGSMLSIRYADRHPTVAAVWGGPILSVQPAQVASAIRRAKAAGWRADEPGPGFTIAGDKTPEPGTSADGRSTSP
jgi:hypothetical protein